MQRERSKQLPRPQRRPHATHRTGPAAAAVDHRSTDTTSRAGGLRWPLGADGVPKLRRRGQEPQSPWTVARQLVSTHKNKVQGLLRHRVSTPMAAIGWRRSQGRIYSRQQQPVRQYGALPGARQGGGRLRSHPWTLRVSLSSPESHGHEAVQVALPCLYVRGHAAPAASLTCAPPHPWPSPAAPPRIC
jgi:hypothetical protein